MIEDIERRIATSSASEMLSLVAGLDEPARRRHAASPSDTGEKTR